MDLVADQKPRKSQPFCRLGGFSSRRGAQIQHTLPRLRIQKRHCPHSTGLLNIVQTCFVKRAFSRPGLLLIIKAFLTPGNLPQAKQLLIPLIQFLYSALSAMEAKPMGPLPLIALHKGFVFLPQHLFHPYQKLLRQLS